MGPTDPERLPCSLGPLLVLPKSCVEDRGRLAGPQPPEHRGTLQLVLEWGRASRVTTLPPLLELWTGSGPRALATGVTVAPWGPGVNHSFIHPFSRYVLSPTLASCYVGGKVGIGQPTPHGAPHVRGLGGRPWQAR